MHACLRASALRIQIQNRLILPREHERIGNNSRRNSGRRQRQETCSNATTRQIEEKLRSNAQTNLETQRRRLPFHPARTCASSVGHCDHPVAPDTWAQQDVTGFETRALCRCVRKIHAPQARATKSPSRFMHSPNACDPPRDEHCEEIELQSLASQDCASKTSHLLVELPPASAKTFGAPVAWCLGVRAKPPRSASEVP